MDRRRAYPWDVHRDHYPVTQSDRFTNKGRFTLMPGGLGKWEATPAPPRATTPTPAPAPRAIQRTPVSSAPTPPAMPLKEETIRVFAYTPAGEVASAARAVAEHAIRHALNLHGLQPSQIELQWITRLAPGATVMSDGEFHGPHNMAGKTRSDGHDGRTVTILLRHDLPLKLIAETALHEAFHAVQFLHAPAAMRNRTITGQIEEQALDFAARQLPALKGLLAALQSPKRMRSLI